MPLPRRNPSLEPDDRELFARLGAGDVAAFETLFVRYFATLVSFAQSYVRSQDVAEDVVQDVFCRLWDRRESLQLKSGIAQYLYGAVRHGTLDAIKHDRVAARWEERELLDLERRTAANEGVARVEADELASVVSHVISALPPRCREVFQLSRYKHLTQRDIADTLGITVNTVNVQLGRALRAIDAAVQAWERNEEGSSTRE